MVGLRGIDGCSLGTHDLRPSVGPVLTRGVLSDYVVAVADSFVNSQEWTLARSVPDLRLVRIQTDA